MDRRLMRGLSIVVTHNAEPWLHQVLAALLTSTVRSSIAVVDNASTDGTVALLNDRFRSSIDYFFPLERNLGFGNAHNCVFDRIDLGDYDFIFLLNQDASLEPETMEQLLRVAGKAPEYGVISPVHYYSAGVMDKKFAKHYKPSAASAARIAGYTVQEVNFVNAAIWLVNARAVEEVGGFDPLHYHYGEDRTFVHRIRHLGYKVGVVREAIGYHYRDQLENGLDRKSRAERLCILHTTYLLNPVNSLLLAHLRIMLIHIRVMTVELFSGRFGGALSFLYSLLRILRITPAIYRSRLNFTRSRRARPGAGLLAR